MIAPDELVIGKQYFLVCFYDQKLKIPNIKTMIYLGHNGLQESGKMDDKWYFQDPNIYSAPRKTAKETSDKYDKDRFVASADTLNHIYDLVGLIALLEKVRFGILAKIGI